MWNFKILSPLGNVDFLPIQEQNLCPFSTHLLDLRHDFVRVPRGRRLHAPREAEGARLHLSRNTADAALVDRVTEKRREENGES